MFKYNFIYKTTCVVNNIICIGKHSTDKLEDGYLGSAKRLKEDILKYGKENFKREILEYCNDVNKLCELEKFYILKHNSLNTEIGYNQKLHSSLGTIDYKHTEENILKMKKFQKENHKFSDESRAAFLERSNNQSGELNPMFGIKGEFNSNTGVKRSEETKLKMKLNHADFSGENHPMWGLKGRDNPNTGKKRTEETKAKMRYPKTEEHKNKIREARKFIQKIKCPYCGKDVLPNLFERWHNNNCKNK